MNKQQIVYTLKKTGISCIYLGPQYIMRGPLRSIPPMGPMFIQGGPPIGMHTHVRQTILFYTLSTVPVT